MRIAHLSDLHLGYRAFPSLERGGNLRERDLTAAFHHAVHEVGRLAPDLVLLAGDLFHHADPPSTAFLALTRGIRRLQELLPGVPVLAIAGECDTPLAPGDPGPVSVLDAVPGVEAAAGAPRAVRLERLGAHVLLVPHRSVVRPPFPELRPDPSARWNVLLVRGHPGGMARGGVLPLEVDPHAWDYVAVGGAHRFREWSPKVVSSGSLERVGADPWSEGAVDKGFVMADLSRGEVEFHPLPARPVVDLAPVRVDAGDPSAGTRRLRDLLEGFPGGVDGKLVRVRLKGDLLAPSEGVSPGLLAGIRRRAAHLDVQVEHPLGSILRQRPEPAGMGPVGTLAWQAGAGRSGELPLHPGLWGVSAASPGDLEAVAMALLRATPTSAEAPRLAFVLHGGPRVDGVDATSPSDAPPPGVEAELPPEPELPAALLRADWIEADGDAEARALDWIRERQEAESRLRAYRERARELRERIRILREEGHSARCPTCRRPLAEAHPSLLSLLEEEWEEVVQDGTWWKRRRTQLEDKPSDLLTLERRALRLQSRLAGESGPVPAQASPSAGAPRRPPREVLVQAAHLLRRATEGRLEGIRPAAGTPSGARVPMDQRGLEVVEAGGLGRPPSRGEEALVELALEAAAPLASGSPGDPRVHLLLAGRSGVPEAELVRLLDAVAGIPGVPLAWIAVLPGGAAASLPHRMEGLLEVSRDDDDRFRVRRAPPGRARIVLARPRESAR